MNIREELLSEKTQNKHLAIRVAEIAVKSHKNFKELIQCFLDKDHRVAQRAAWSVSWAARARPEMIKPFIRDLVSQLERKDVHAAIIRNTLRVLEAIDIPEAYQGKVMNACFKLIEEPSTPVAIKAFSVTTLYNLSKLYPEIKPELKMVIEEIKDNESVAFRSRANKILPFL